MKKSELVGLKSKIAELAAQGVEIRKQIQVARDRERYDLWDEKRVVGYEARAQLLAYAFLRGVPYRHVESGAKIPEERYARDACLKNRAYYVSSRAAAATQQPMDEAAIIAWLQVPEAPERVAAREAAVKASRERAHTRRVAQQALRKGAA